ncbi:hypothetical protein Tco_1318130 [Tanacetum coccineum]
MPPRMRTRSAGRPTAESLGGGTGVRVGRDERGRRPREGNDEYVDMTKENVGNVLVNGNRVGCSYKEFLACNPKEYNSKGGAVVLTRWIEKIENCLADPTLKVPLDEIRVDAKLNFVEEPVEILEREFKKLKRSRIAIVKILYRVDGGDFMRYVMI